MSFIVFVAKLRFFGGNVEGWNANVRVFLEREWTRFFLNANVCAFFGNANGRAFFLNANVCAFFWNANGREWEREWTRVFLEREWTRMVTRMDANLDVDPDGHTAGRAHHGRAQDPPLRIPHSRTFASHSRAFAFKKEQTFASHSRASAFKKEPTFAFKKNKHPRSKRTNIRVLKTAPLSTHPTFANIRVPFADIRVQKRTNIRVQKEQTSAF
jgi:hypothetical protein